MNQDINAAAQPAPKQNAWKGFVEFIRTQGVVGLAVGFILGKAISDIVGSVVNDIINPIIGIFLGRFGDLSNLALTIGDANISYGKFLSMVINFIIIAAVIYFGVKKLGLDKLDKPKQ
jgi:large conductance mechanosensitive channel